jgi:succinate dehydrogenase / fumarate reductase flavoprotein subunit
MGGLWVDYNLMSTVPGLHVLGEANFSDHGANRLGASALMQGLCDGYFVIPYTLGHYLAGTALGKVTTDHAAFGEAEAQVRQRLKRLLTGRGKKTVRDFHWELGRTLWDNAGMSRNAAGLRSAIDKIRTLRQEFWENVCVTGSGEDFNKNLEMAGRVADYFELGELLCRDALQREESCGCHFREEHQTPEGELQRDDEHFAFVAAWEFMGDDADPVLHREPLHFETAHLATRSYK